jgi:hypothetical protein|tara:strand:- start:373 stop:1035 length:663 start_codon:yes stop_codon:yes gene_type:complete
MSNYFSQLPNFEYVSRLPDARISDYISVKNLFKKGKLREDIIDSLAVFTKYKIKGDDRPDNVAQELYGDPNLDWVVLSSNNILNVYNEWPMTQINFENYLLEKYGSFTEISAIHHYETTELKNKEGAIIVAAGLEVDSNFSITYYDAIEKGYNTKFPVTSVTNYDYEVKIQDDRRNIFTLKPRYLNIVKDDLKEMMEYKKGSTQYKSRTLKTADNIRLYQ